MSMTIIFEKSCSCICYTNIIFLSSIRKSLDHSFWIKSFWI